MNYELNIDINDRLEETMDSILGEFEEAIENIRKYHDSGARHTEDVDIDELLANHHAIAVIWDAQHVKDQRPDLTDEQAWEVLRSCSHERLNDPMLDTIQDAAATLYPLPRNARPARAGEVIASYGEGDERENLVDLLTDIMHWCEGFEEPFDEFCGTARTHFNTEVKTYRKGN